MAEYAVNSCTICTDIVLDAIREEDVITQSWLELHTYQRNVTLQLSYHTTTS